MTNTSLTAERPTFEDTREPYTRPNRETAAVLKPEYAKTGSFRWVSCTPASGGHTPGPCKLAAKRGLLIKAEKGLYVSYKFKDSSVEITLRRLAVFLPESCHSGFSLKEHNRQTASGIHLSATIPHGL